MIPSFKPGILSSNKIRASAGPADVTPNAVDWSDDTTVFWTSGTIVGTFDGAKTISGINTAINIYYECIYCGDGGQIYYKKNGGSWIAVSALENISVSNNDTIDWGYSGGPETLIQFQVKNASDSNAVLDSFVSFYLIF